PFILTLDVIACPSGGQPSGMCMNGRCGPGNSCVPSANVCCPTSQPAACPSGGQPAGMCMNGLCGTGYTCVPSANICCGTNQPVCKF
uniref:CC domain-containing protein n=1 Tax=Plectus sambesii TaxID=2011161 RepID=A0A914VF08_9BILA